MAINSNDGLNSREVDLVFHPLAQFANLKMSGRLCFYRNGIHRLAALAFNDRQECVSIFTRHTADIQRGANFVGCYMKIVVRQPEILLSFEHVLTRIASRTADFLPEVIGFGVNLWG